jgi:beta-glucosidase
LVDFCDMQFPSGFLWGASTASHQVEGGNLWNDWWECEQDGRLPCRSEEACRHYELYASDFDLARGLGHNAHRLSIEWSRIEPVAGEWNEAALQHYADVIEALRSRGIEPVVTLHHFSNPAWFARNGGWTRSDAVSLFARYVERVAARLCGSVRWWLTINEPTVYAKQVFVLGNWPPCRRHGWWRTLLGLRNLCRAHTAAFDILHRHRADALVGFAHSAPYVVPCNPQRRRDRAAAWLRDLALNRLVFLLLGRRPRRVLDYLGVNYYTRQVVRTDLRGGSWLFGTECREPHHETPRSFNLLGWEIFPAGLTGILRRLARHGVPLLVTENGIATLDEAQRTAFLLGHVRALGAALEQGIDVRGYLYWTLYDNFEWREGYAAHFGLAAVDRATQARSPRPAAAAYAAICRANALPRADVTPR